MAVPVDKKSETKEKVSRLSERDTRLLLVLSSELLKLCAKLAGPIDPAAAAMMNYVNDEIKSEEEAQLQ